MDELRITVQQVSPRIQVHLGPGGLSNSAALMGDRAVLVVDSTYTPGLARQVKAAVREVTDRPIRYLLNTHSHSDHVFGNQEFGPEALVLAHRLTRDRMLKDGDGPVVDSMRRRPHLRAEFEQVRMVMPEVGFEGTLEIDLGGLVVQCLHVGPAHTTGDVAVWVPDQRFLFISDLIFNGIFPVLRTADVAGWLGSLDRLEALGPETVAPGHGAIGGAAIIGAQREVLVEIRGTVLAARERGLTLEQALETLRFPRYEGLPMAGERLPDAIRRLYA